MISNFEKNIEDLQHTIFNAKPKIEEWKKIKVDKDYLTKCSEGFYFKEGENTYKIVSNHPKEEAKLYCQNIDFKKDNLIIIFGIVNIPLLIYLTEHMSKESKALIIEPDEKKLKYVLEYEDVTQVFKNQNVGLIVGNELDATMKTEIEAYTCMGWDNLVYNIKVIVLANYEMYKTLAHEVMQYFHEKMSFRITVLGNCLEDAFNGFSNSYHNIPSFFEANSLEEIKGKFQGIPGIVVASGPSLEKNIKYLNRANDKALIIACDASVDACKANGVKIQGVASVERDEPTYTYYYKGKTFDERLVLVGPSLLWPLIYKEYKGKKIIASKTDIGPEGWVTSFFDNVIHENIGMSSANVAFETLLLAGCDPIILVGQDLAYTNNKKHAEETHTEYEGENDMSEFDGTYVEGIDGEMIPTDFVYNLFRYWIEAKIADYCLNKTVIDATEGGAKIKGAEIKNLKDTIEEYCTKELPYDIYGCLEERKIDKADKIKRYENMIEKGTKEIDTIKKIQSMAVEHYELLEKLYAKKIEKQTEKQLVNTVKQMEKGNQIIADIEAEETFNTLFRPIIKQTITHVKALGNKLTAENVIANLKLQGNLMGMIMRSCDLIIEKFENMIEELNKQKMELE